MDQGRWLAERCRVVLVRPAIAANLGATARVMRNFGVMDLRLVAPHADPADQEARKLSTHGESLLCAAQSTADLSEAVHDCVLVLGTSARTGGPYRRQSVVYPNRIMPEVVATLASGPVAFVFGPEQTGLTNVEVTRCHYLLKVPTDETYPTLNLAQAVAICLYELRKAWLTQTGLAPPNPIAPFAIQEQMYADLEAALRAVHFLWGDNAASLMHALRHLIGRAQPTPIEVDILLGLARQLRWYASNHEQKKTNPEQAGGYSERK
jgi:tRNA/rRNA methyltransferase